MTKIPSVKQEILKWMNAYVPEGKTVPVFEDLLEQYATAERTDLLTELRGEIEDELQLLSRAYAGLETLPEKSANLAIRDSFIKLLSSLDTPLTDKK